MQHYLSVAHPRADTQSDATVVGVAADAHRAAAAVVVRVAHCPRTANTVSHWVYSCAPGHEHAASLSTWPACRCPCTLDTCTDPDPPMIHCSVSTSNPWPFDSDRWPLRPYHGHATMSPSVAAHRRPGSVSLPVDRVWRPQWNLWRRARKRPVRWVLGFYDVNGVVFGATFACGLCDCVMQVIL